VEPYIKEAQHSYESIFILGFGTEDENEETYPTNSASSKNMSRKIYELKEGSCMTSPPIITIKFRPPANNCKEVSYIDIICICPYQDQTQGKGMKTGKSKLQRNKLSFFKRANQV
jgi:hypothetical protein